MQARAFLLPTFVALAVLAVLPGSSNAVAAAATDGKLVVFGEDPENRDLDGLYVLNADGSGLRQITHSIVDEQPHWSPDGSWIALVHSGYPTDTIEVIRDDGSGRRVLGPGDEGGNALLAPSPWSPDGTRLAWGGCGGLCVYQLASATRLGIKLGDGDGSGFSWSPDGTRIAAVDSDGKLVVVDADGSGRLASSRARARRSLRGRRTERRSPSSPIVSSQLCLLTAALLVCSGRPSGGGLGGPRTGGCSTRTFRGFAPSIS